MKKITFFAMAAMVAMGLSGCQKGEPGNGGNGATTDSRMGLTLELPANFFAPESRAEQDAIDAETTVTTIDVWVFNADGTKADGNWPAQRVLADFTRGEDEESNIYTLNSGKYIQVQASKNARVYVGVNVTDGVDSNFDNEAALLKATDILSSLTTSGFTMFSPVNEVTLIPYTEGDEDTVTDVEVDVERVVSKVVATMESDIMAPATDYNEGEEVTLSYEILEYNVYNEATASYLVKQAKTLSTLNGFNASYGKGNEGIELMEATEFAGDLRNDALVDLENIYYIGENNSKLAEEANSLSLVENTTYAFVSTKVTVSKTAVYNTTTEEFEWTGDESTGTEDLYIVYPKDENGVPTGESYICLTEAYNALAPASVSVNSFKYKASYVHFLVWLNHEGTNDANIGRNQFIHLHVEGVGGAAGTFPGYPGTEDDPKKPIDPITTPNNPDPKDPKDPIDPVPSMLKVKITVKPWTYKYNGVVLSK